MAAGDPTRRSRPSLTRSSRGSAPHLLLATFPKVRRCSTSYHCSRRQRQRALYPWGASIGDVRVLTTAGPLLSLSRGAAAVMDSLLSRGRHFGSQQPRSSQGKFRAKSTSKEGRRGPYPCWMPSDHLSLQFSRPPVVIMAGFMRWARFVARERRTMRAAPSDPGHAP
ncbi:hypothetical protein NDU88_005864 [Pleurodeles waltl]|uniref:Uncharacterized protein n=1 Tax=Pleurodeles waltl TaxID=8319 RepID=A0AAV7SMW7_PLEWA|nr:hypothetical protein NDU88_005864 [Pleurodeles waltl]